MAAGPGTVNIPGGFVLSGGTDADGWWKRSVREGRRLGNDQNGRLSKKAGGRGPEGSDYKE